MWKTQKAQIHFTQKEKHTCLKKLIKSQKYPIWSLHVKFNSDQLSKKKKKKKKEAFQKTLTRSNFEWPHCSLYQTNTSTPIPPFSSCHSYPTMPQEGYLFWEEGGKLSIITTRNRLVTRGHIHTFPHLMSKTHQKIQYTRSHVSDTWGLSIVLLFWDKWPSLPAPWPLISRTGEQHYSFQV